MLTRDAVEQVLVQQRRWEETGVGRACEDHCMDPHRRAELTDSLLRGIVKPRNRRAKGVL